MMPVFEFDETMGEREVDGRKLLDYWGYNTVGFFAPNTSYTVKIAKNKVFWFSATNGVKPISKEVAARRGIAKNGPITKYNATVKKYP